jgi:hypothetical protein
MSETVKCHRLYNPIGAGFLSEAVECHCLYNPIIPSFLSEAVEDDDNKKFKTRSLE